MSENALNSIRIGVVGAGGFALFAVSEFVKIAGVQLVAVYDESPANSERLKAVFSSVTICSSLKELYSDKEVDLVYIATPPSFHFGQSKEALMAGKHVICEKPAAIEVEHAIELQRLAKQKGLLYVVNLMQRYNILFDTVKEVIDQKILGDFLRGFFENYASDEALSEPHWFWDDSISGGIFIEHGVHFFDLFSGWLGEGRIVASQKLKRPGYMYVTDRVQATALYGGGLVNFYHGFDQPKAMDRQETRLLFERGEITLYEWVPTRLKMTALCSEKELAFFKSKFPNATIDVVVEDAGGKTACGRFKEIHYHYKLVLDTGDFVQKQDLYQTLVRRMLEDQLTWIHNPNHKRKITDENALTSLKMAVDAERSAEIVNES